jgi:uncharacterized protein involved in type VI secretion and phage assembly
MFTIAQDKTGNAGLAAVCDICGEVQLTQRDDSGECVLPNGWVRVSSAPAGAVYGVHLVRSVLRCKRCEHNN